MSFLRVFQHLLPDAQAWRIVVQKTLRSFFEGLTGTFDDARGFFDDVYGDAFPATTRELTEWEKQYGLTPNADDDTRRLTLAAEWAATGGQSPGYLQGVLHTAGFTDVFIHEWWESGPPYVARDPRDYTIRPTIGSVQCGEELAQCGEPSALCNAFLANDPGYLVNLDLTSRAPPVVPDDSGAWRYFLYFGGETFPELAYVPSDRRDEFERLVLKLRPAQQWVVLLVDYVSALTTEDGDTIITEDGATLLASS